MLGCLSILKRLRGAAIPINLCVFQAVLLVVFGFFLFLFLQKSKLMPHSSFKWVIYVLFS